MLARNSRLRRRSDFNRVHKQGQIKHLDNFSIKYHQSNLDHPRIAVVVSTKVSKRAVDRNRLRRRIYAQVREVLPSIKPGSDIIVMVRRSAMDRSSQELAQELVKSLASSNLLKEI